MKVTKGRPALTQVGKMIRGSDHGSDSEPFKVDFNELESN